MKEDFDLAALLGDPFISKHGRSPTLAARLDSRCSYCLYSPDPASREFDNLLVYVHGQGRRFQFLLNQLRPLARALRSLVLCPLFPGNLFRDGNLEGYKYLSEQGLRYDEVLNDMVSELRGAFAFREPRLLLGGFSGGAQFAHRFCYLHPEKVKAVSIAAPGSVTLLRSDIPWWPGVGSIHDWFGSQLDLDSLRNVSFQLVVGDSDIAESGTVFDESHPRWVENANLAGRNRLDRLRALHRSLQAEQISATLEVVPHAGHDFGKLLPAIEAFFSAVAAPGSG